MMDDTVLYIDDEETNLLLFGELFSEYYCVHKAKSTSEAEQLISQVDFKVIVSDINMPKETGLQFFNRLPQMEVSPVFVILTAHISDRLLLEALNQGRIFRYITKPFRKDMVKDIIDQAIMHYNLLYEKAQLNLQIQESQQNFYNIFQSSMDGILIIDKNETILEVNDVVVRNLNEVPGNLIGNKLSNFVPGQFHANLKEKVGQMFDNGVSRSEFEFFSENFAKRVFEVSASSIQFKGSNAILLIIRDITQRRLDEFRLMNAVVHAEESERSRIAKDLHDGLGPIMSSLKMYLEWLNKQGSVNQHTDVLELSLKSVNEAIVTLKRVSNNLSPHILEKFGLQAALGKFIDNIKAVSDIRFNLVIELNGRLELSTEISLYRIITECITNTIKHARATLVDILLRHDNHFILFTYQDNGIGFVSPSGYQKGMGLHNISNRIKTLGGQMTMESSDGRGFKLDSKIPII